MSSFGKPGLMVLLGMCVAGGGFLTGSDGNDYHPFVSKTLTAFSIPMSRADLLPGRSSPIARRTAGSHGTRLWSVVSPVGLVDDGPDPCHDLMVALVWHKGWTFGPAVSGRYC